MFGLDESKSLSESDYQFQLNWLIKLLNHFIIDINSGKVRVGVVMFHHYARTAIPLSNYTYGDLKERIQNISQQRGGTYIISAINTCRAALEGSGRQAAKEMIILTDGYSWGDIDRASRLARRRGIRIAAVGVGPGVRNDILRQVTGDPTLVFRATDYGGLDEVTTELKHMIKTN